MELPILGSLPDLKLPSWGPRHFRAETGCPHDALFKFLTYKICEHSKWPFYASFQVVCHPGTALEYSASPSSVCSLWFTHASSWPDFWVRLLPLRISLLPPCLAWTEHSPVFEILVCHIFHLLPNTWECTGHIPRIILQIRNWELSKERFKNLSN